MHSEVCWTTSRLQLFPFRSGLVRTRSKLRNRCARRWNVSRNPFRKAWTTRLSTTRRFSCANRFAHENRRVVDNLVVHAFRKGFLETFHRLAHLLRSFERVRTRPLRNGNSCSRLVVQQTSECIRAR